MIINEFQIDVNRTSLRIIRINIQSYESYDLFVVMSLNFHVQVPIEVLNHSARVDDKIIDKMIDKNGKFFF